MNNQPPQSKLMDFLSEYEAEGFSAKDSGATPTEILKMTDILLNRAVLVLMGKIGTRYIEITGNDLSEMLASIRQEANQQTEPQS